MTDLITQIRRNHGLEHATIHILSNDFQKFSAQGNATINGFHLNLFSDIPAENVEKAAREALRLAAQKLPVTTKFIVRNDYQG